MERVSPYTLGHLIDELSEIRELRRFLAAEDKVLEDKYKEVAALVQEQLIENDMASASGCTATASLSHIVVGTIDNYETAIEFMKNKGYLHLLGRSLSAPAFREVYELELNRISSEEGFDPEKFDPATVLPGMRPFTVTKLNLATLKTPRKVA